MHQKIFQSSTKSHCSHTSFRLGKRIQPLVGYLITFEEWIDCFAPSLVLRQHCNILELLDIALLSKNVSVVVGMSNSMPDVGDKWEKRAAKQSPR